jgi:hypothetical protein
VRRPPVPIERLGARQDELTDLDEARGIRVGTENFDDLLRGGDRLRWFLATDPNPDLMVQRASGAQPKLKTVTAREIPGETRIDLERIPVPIL